jgi:pimeloyl-ACP methyl ester carboxylesterase
MASIWFIAGPPFDTPFWKDAAQRLQSRDLSAHCYPLLRHKSGSIADEREQLIDALSKSDDDIVLVGHGTALPLILSVEKETRLRGIVLSNGPLGEFDLVTRSLSRVAKIPKPMDRIAFNPNLWLRFLSSSVGLRRTVVNPYVMDRDTVVAICGPIFTNSDVRGRAKTYLSSLSDLHEKGLDTRTPTLVCWGNSDPINRSNISNLMGSGPEEFTLKYIEGGRFLHPVERPWEIADAIFDWLQNSPTTT